jgi:hypothetical protein
MAVAAIWWGPPLGMVVVAWSPSRSRRLWCPCSCNRHDTHLSMAVHRWNLVMPVGAVGSWGSAFDRSGAVGLRRRTRGRRIQWPQKTWMWAWCLSTPMLGILGKVTGEGRPTGVPRHRLYWVIVAMEHRSADKRGTLAAPRSWRSWNPGGGDNLGGGGN